MPIVELTKLAEFVKAIPVEPGLILLKGDLGAGKTTLVKTLLQQAGAPSKQINSPTFSLVNEYNTPKINIKHLDLYRLEQKSDLESLGIDEILDLTDQELVIIEWPAIIGEINLPHLLIKLEHVNDPHQRQITLSRIN